MAILIKANRPELAAPVDPQLAAKHFDIIGGLDFHVLKVPWPVTPCPITPFSAVVFDPMDYIHCTIPAMPSYTSEGGFSLGAAPMGGTVKINGFYRGATNSSLVGLPSVPPVPGKFAKLAKIGKALNLLHFAIPHPLFLLPKFFHPHEGQISHGSKTVITQGENQSTQFCRAYSCQDVGKVLFNNPTGGFYLNYLTTVLVILPMGNPVLIGGVKEEKEQSWADLVNALMFMGLSKAAGFLGKKALKLTGKLLTKTLSKIEGKFPKFKKFRDAVQPTICKYLGEPVDATSGHMTSYIAGFELPGVIPFKWEANYYSDSEYEGPLGKSIYHSYDMSLQIEQEDECVIMSDTAGRPVVFPMLRPGERFFNPKEKYELHCDENGKYYVSDKAGLYYYFEANSLGNADIKQLSKIVNRDGASIVFTYSKDGHLLEIRDSMYRVIKVSTDNKGCIVSMSMDHPDLVDVSFTPVRYEYDNRGRMMRFYNAQNSYNELSWERHLIKSRKFNNGVVFTFEYDKQDRCTAAVNSAGLFSYYFTYYKGYTEVTNSIGSISTYYHKKGIVNKIVNSLGAEQLFVYDDADNLLVQVNEQGISTSYVYDERSNVISIEQSSRGKVSLEYNDLDLPIEIKLPTGISWLYEYNQTGKLIKKTNPLGKQVLYHYMEDGQIAGVRNVLGQDTYFNYHKGELVRIILPNGGSINYQYDKLGRCTEIQSPTGAQYFREYDLLGQVIKVSDQGGMATEIKYDSMGNAVVIKDAKRYVSMEYNFFGDVTVRSENKSQVRFTYDLEGNLTQVLNENYESYIFDLDSEGNVIKETGFDGIVHRYERDHTGRVRQKIKANGHIDTYSYNSAGNLTTILHQADQSYEEFDYDITGALIKANNKDAKVSFSYDVMGNLVEEKSNDHWIRNEYNDYGQRTKTTSSLGADIDLSYDPLKGLLDKLEVNGWSSSYEYNYLGQEINRSLSGGIAQESSYDKFGRLIRQDIKGKHGKTQRHRQYLWHGDTLSGIKDSVTGEKRFNHDIYGNLSEVIYGDGSVEYRPFDLVGNLYQSKEMKDRKYEKGGRLISKGNRKYKYDKLGNLIEKQLSRGESWQYQWDESGMLSEVIRPDGHSVHFAYDALGRRLYKRYKQTTTHYVWDGNVPLHEYKSFDAREATADDIITWVFEEGNFAPLAKIKGDKRYSIVTDHLGTPILGYSDSGDKVWERELDSFGKVRMSVGDEGFCNYLYQGQTLDKETGLAYNRFRYYSPEEGNYISQDPIRLRGGGRLYGYVKTPTQWLDIFGLEKRAGNTSFIGNSLHPATVTLDNPGGLIVIQATGSHRADKVAVYDKTKNPDVWSDDYRLHHVSYDPKTNEMTMQIVNRKDHEGLSHVGGAKDFKDDTKLNYNTPEAIAEAESRREAQENSKAKGCQHT